MCNTMSKKRVLVTGGAGYIGSHTTVELINAGYEVIVVDNFSNSDASSLEGVKKITGVAPTFVEVDCCDKEAMRRVFEDNSFDAVIHFAAYKAVGESVAQPAKYYRNNLLSFINVVELMKEYHCKNIVFSSSATVYGDAEELPVTERTPRKPATSPYGNTKQMAEDMDGILFSGGTNIDPLKYGEQVDMDEICAARSRIPRRDLRQA